MNKLVALMLLFAVPAFAQQQVSLTPLDEQAEPVAAVQAAQEEAAVPWKPIFIAGAAVTAAVILAIVVSVVVSAQAPKPIQKSDVPCNNGGGCDGWINEPAM